MTRDSNTFISSLSQAVRDNPVAAALIGGGAVWLMCGNRPIGSAFGGAGSIAQPLAESGRRGVAKAADTMTSAADAVTSAGAQSADAVKEGARSASRAAGDAAASGTSALKEGLSETFDQATDTMYRTAEALRSVPNPLPHLQKGYVTTQSTLTDLFERQPLVLGAVGLAIGAGVASALTTTAFENEWAGPFSDDVKDAVKERVQRAGETAERGAREAGSEFRAAAGDAAEKLRKTGQEAAQSVRETADAGREF
jgi:hypothetical protein